MLYAVDDSVVSVWRMDSGTGPFMQPAKTVIHLPVHHHAPLVFSRSCLVTSMPIPRLAPVTNATHPGSPLRRVANSVVPNVTPLPASFSAAAMDTAVLLVNSLRVTQHTAVSPNLCPYPRPRTAVVVVVVGAAKNKTALL